MNAEAVEYDLIALGLRLDWLGTRRLSWRDLAVIVKQSPETSALYRAQVGVENYQWRLQEQLLAIIADVLAWTAWSRTKDAQTGRNRPKPIQRPGVERDDASQYGSDPMSLEDIDDWLGWATPLAAKPQRLRDSRGRFIKKTGGGTDG